MSLTHTTDANFDQDVLQSDVPVLLDFWAEWCGPCKMIGPLLVELSEEYAKKVKIVKLNVDENNNTAIQYAVRSIPTLILFKDGQVQAQHIGAAAKGQLKQFIDSNL
ncbi:MAG TPA: thioredoxin TrxA [Gammaproteobacteria bacterium]|jgi:thioredoxin 1|nr:thioredoxin TrxA [Gammaproteobacteria bacterium]HIK97254.1 thioredoxin TrxA [Gammaproteobacteria bacterium]